MEKDSPNINPGQSSHRQAPHNQSKSLLPCATTSPELTSSGQSHQSVSGWTINTPAASTATVTSSVTAWIKHADAPYIAVSEIVGAAPTYVTDNCSSSRAMTTIARQGSAASDDGEDESEVRGEKSKNVMNDQEQNKGSRQPKNS